MSHSLGLSFYKKPLSADSVFPLSSSGAGLRGLVTNGIKKILVEVVTYHKHKYIRFLVLVCLGVGCTVWWASAPGFDFRFPEGAGVEPFDSYDPFFNMDHIQHGFRRVGIVERNDVSASVVSAMGTEQFADITIPAIGPMHKGVSLALIIFALGLAPKLADAIVN